MALLSTESPLRSLRSASLRHAAALAAGVLVTGWAVACVSVALPGTLRLAADRGHWAGPTSGLRRSAATPLLRGGQRAGLLVRLGGREAEAVTLVVSRRRPDRPATLDVFRGRTRLNGVVLRDAPRRLRVATVPGAPEIDLQLVATSLRPRVPPAYFVHEIRIERPASFRSRLFGALPLLLGLLVLWTAGRRLPRWLAASWAMAAAALATAALVPLWDRAAGWQLAPSGWLAVAGLFAALFAGLAVLTRSVRRVMAGTPLREQLRRHLRAQWATWAAALAVLPQLAIYAGHPVSDPPGWVYSPRIKAMLGVSVTADLGGPFATEPIGGNHYSLAPAVLNDVGLAAIVDAWGRLSGVRADETTLVGINLGFLAAAAAVLILAWPRDWRWALVPVLLGVPLCPSAYRSPDSVAIHGALAALALGAALLAPRRGSVGAGLASGALLFVLHKVRSVYLLYAAVPLAASALTLALVRRRRLLTGLLLPLAVFAVLDVPWRRAMEERSSDPRVVNGEILAGHNVYEPLVSGVGWSENRWGIEPWDVDVAMFIGERLGEEAVDITTAEGERKARRVYGSLWAEAPGHMLGLYLRRLPAAFAEHFLWGAPGAVLWFLVGGAALRLSWRLRDREAASVLIACAVLAGGFVAQVVLIDPRPLYAYPLRLTSALGLAASAAALWRLRRPRANRGTRELSR